MDIICSMWALLAAVVLPSILAKIEHHKECYPKRIYPQCPPSHPPEPIVVPHPLVKNLDVLNRPRTLWKNVKVTVDGRMAEIYEPREYYFDEPPLRLPPWVRPRIQSVELRGGSFKDCQCWKKNGLSDSCQRWDCGRPECLTKPLPECPPGFDPPIFGVRKGNAMIAPLIQRPKPAIPPEPYPGLVESKSSKMEPIPNPAFIACPLHQQFMPSCKQ